MLRWWLLSILLRVTETQTVSPTASPTSNVPTSVPTSLPTNAPSNGTVPTTTPSNTTLPMNATTSNQTNMTTFNAIRSAVYYFPGVIGMHPLHGTDRVLGDADMYTEVFKSIHDRDLEWLAQVTDTIRIAGFFPYPYTADNYFFDKVHSLGLRVIVSFSMLRYRQLALADTATYQNIMEDFSDFVKILKHPAVIAVCLGDVDDEWAEFQFPSQNSLIRPLLTSLIQRSKSELVGIPVGVAMFYDTTGEAAALKTVLTGLDFDFWIFNTARSTVRDMQKAFLTYPGDTKPALLQVSESAWNFNEFEPDEEVQAEFYEQILEFVTQQRTKPNQIIAPIFSEWVDQWWRYPYRSNCIVDAPYEHSSCGSVMNYQPNEASAFNAIEYNGLCRQFNLPWEMHCISPRAALFHVANFTNRIPKFDKNSRNCSTNSLFSLLYLWLMIPMIVVIVAGGVKVCASGGARKISPKERKKQAEERKQAEEKKQAADKKQAEDKKKAEEKKLDPVELQKLNEYFQLHLSVHFDVASRCVDLFLASETATIIEESQVDPSLSSDPDTAAQLAARILTERLLHMYFEHTGMRDEIMKHSTETLTLVCKIYRTIWSLAEQAAYCPSVINTVFHDFMTKEKPIHVQDLYKHLNKIKDKKPKLKTNVPVFANKYNFDDKEDAARLELKREKGNAVAWHIPTGKPQVVFEHENENEPVGGLFLEFTSVFILLDFLSHYRYILYLKLWVLVSAYYYSLATAWEAVGFIGFFVKFEVWLRVVCEVLLILCSSRRTLKLTKSAATKGWPSVIFTVVDAGAPVVTSLIVLGLWYWKNEIGLLLIFRAVEALLLLVIRATRNLYRRREENNKQKAGSPPFWANLGAICKDSLRKSVFWIVVFVLTWVVEAFLLSAVVKNFTLETICVESSNSCNLDCLGLADYCSNQCTACKAGVYTMYVVVILGSMLDTHLVFNIVLSAVGYLVGIQEKTSAVYYDVTFRWTDCFERLQGAFFYSPELSYLEEKKDSNRDHVIAQARMLWEQVVEDLRSRDLISNQQCERLRLRSDEPLAVRSLGLGAESRDRLVFFYRSLPAVHEECEKRNKKTFERLTLSITTYDESVLTSRSQLRKKFGGRTALEHLVDNTPEEWNFVCERICETSASLKGKTPDDILQMFLSKATEHRQFLWIEWEIQKWASYRQQTVARTIRGCINYFKALQILLGKGQLRREDGELLVAHQTYASVPKWEANVDKAVDWLERMEAVERVFFEFRQFSDCLYLIYDYEFGGPKCGYNQPTKPGEPPKSPSITELRVHEKYNALRNQFLAYMNANESTKGLLGRCKHFSVMAHFKNGRLSIYQVLPRQFPLKLGDAQGKSANQLNMLRFASGHYIQVNDANMDLWLGEALKFPFTCNRFLVKEEDNVNYKPRMPQYRIVGFREYVYTQFSGQTGKFMGQSEFVFGTIISRAMRWLGSRLHYGHPDFFDLQWAFATGGLSKASAGINTSEDIFAGFTVLRRESGKKVYSSDLLEGQKGREEVFLPASLFLSKISAGFVLLQSSRDVHRLVERLNFFGLLGLYFSAAGFYVVNVLVDFSLYAFMLGFVFLALGSVSLHDIGATGSSLGSEWLVTAGIAALLPLLFELVLEYGMVTGLSKLLSGLLSIQNSVMFFVFSNKIVASSVQQALVTGEASWINTGRPSFFQPFNKAKACCAYAMSTYSSAIDLLLMYFMYLHFADSSGGKHPMYFPIATAIMWLIAPAVFTPQLGEWRLFKEDLYESFHWLTCDIAQPANYKLYDDKDDKCFSSFWWGINRRNTTIANFISLLISAVLFVVMVTTLFSSFLDTLLVYIPVLGLNVVTTTMWIALKGGPLSTTFYLAAPVISFGLIIFLAVPYSNGEWWISLVMLLFLGNTCRHFILVVAGIWKSVAATIAKMCPKRAKKEGQDEVRSLANRRCSCPMLCFWRDPIWDLPRFLFFASFQFYFAFGSAAMVMAMQFALSFVFLCCIKALDRARSLLGGKRARVKPSSASVPLPDLETGKNKDPEARQSGRTTMSTTRTAATIVGQLEYNVAQALHCWWLGLHPVLREAIMAPAEKEESMRHFQLTSEQYDYSLTQRPAAPSPLSIPFSARGTLSSPLGSSSSSLVLLPNPLEAVPSFSEAVPGPSEAVSSPSPSEAVSSP